MATPAEYTAVANDLVKLFTDEVHLLPGFEQSFIPMDKIPEAAGTVAKRAVDTLDAYRAQEKQQ